MILSDRHTFVVVSLFRQRDRFAIYGFLGKLRTKGSKLLSVLAAAETFLSCPTLLVTKGKFLRNVLRSSKPGNFYFISENVEEHRFRRINNGSDAFSTQRRALRTVDTLTHSRTVRGRSGARIPLESHSLTFLPAGDADGVHSRPQQAEADDGGDQQTRTVHCFVGLAALSLTTAQSLTTTASQSSAPFSFLLVLLIFTTTLLGRATEERAVRRSL